MRRRHDDRGRDQAGSALADHGPERGLGRGRVGGGGIGGGRWQQRRPPARTAVQAETVGRRFGRRAPVHTGQVQQNGRGSRGRDRGHRGHAVGKRGRLSAVQTVEQRRVVVGRGPAAVPRHTERGQDTDTDATAAQGIANAAAAAATTGRTTAATGPDQRAGGHDDGASRSTGGPDGGRRTGRRATWPHDRCGRSAVPR